MRKMSKRKMVRQKKNRFIFSYLFGILVGACAELVVNWEMALLVGWDAAALSLISLISFAYFSHGGAQTRKITQNEHVRYPVLDFLIIIASVVSLVVVALLLTGSKGSPFEIAFCIFSVFSSWSLIHILYTVHYAELYYKDHNGEGEGGVSFNNDQLPNFWDFAYLAFTIGMTYQVSDTNFSTTAFRKAALGQALISFLFNTILIAAVINFVASLLS
ncbi:DUF1345 domain-containing protein [Liquorilactobacillus satsumensis]|uniref:DUF1345 domain-containing protein n=1 Tax=Liquorilactobacillus satsumensis TaxID=259059 RepID=UPI0021C39C89|nr:DUF1345 domain-containing protein [Liquorilactobacillus satsumensis]MCP9312413.1 DUF1345 domain-containing protein [Liquorilactobacillus satsumensis]MCP9359583.1 DUF1345 domain-containing protein [Liquorilactobacillus satsumensis]